MVDRLIAIDCAVKTKAAVVDCAMLGASSIVGAMGLLNRLQHLLDRLQISQRELARRARLKNETDVAVLFHRLRADPAATVDSDTLAALARAGGVSVDWLLGLDEPEGVVASSIEDALDAAFVSGQHALRDAEAVRSIARTMAFSLNDDLVGAARAWLDAAASLRREGTPVTAESLLLRLTLGRRATAEQLAAHAEAVDALRLQIEADIQSLGVPATRATELGRGLAEKLRRLRSREE